MYGYAKDVNGVSSPVLLNNIRNINYNGNSIYIEYIGATAQSEGNVNIVLSSPVVSLQVAVEHWIRDNTTGKGANSDLNDYIGDVTVSGVFNAGPSAFSVDYESAADLTAACAASPTTAGFINQNSAFPTPKIGNSIFQTNQMLLPIADGNYSVLSGATKFFVTIYNSIITYVEVCPVEIQKVFGPNEWDNRINGMMSYTGCFLTSMGGSSATSQWFNVLGAQPWIGLVNIPEISNGMSGPTGCDRVYLQDNDPMVGGNYAPTIYYSNVGPTGPWYLWGSWTAGSPYPLGTSSMSSPMGSSMSGFTFSLPAFQHTAGGIDYTFPKSAMSGSTYFCGGTSSMYISSSGSNQGQIVMSNRTNGCGIQSPSTCTFPCP